MMVRRVLVAAVACAPIGLALSVTTEAGGVVRHHTNTSGSIQPAKGPKAKTYTDCDFTATESVCFKGAFEVLHKSQTWRFEEVSGTYTVSGKQFVFRETKPESRDELIGAKGKHGVISGKLYENGKPSEFTFTLTPR